MHETIQEFNVIQFLFKPSSILQRFDWYNSHSQDVEWKICNDVYSFADVWNTCKINPHENICSTKILSINRAGEKKMRLLILLRRKTGNFFAFKFRFSKDFIFAFLMKAWFLEKYQKIEKLRYSKNFRTIGRPALMWKICKHFLKSSYEITLFLYCLGHGFCSIDSKNWYFDYRWNVSLINLIKPLIKNEPLEKTSKFFSRKKLLTDLNKIRWIKQTKKTVGVHNIVAAKWFRKAYNQMWW